MSMKNASVVVTGDVVLDCNLYGGVKTSAASFAEPGTRYSESLGGAVLTYGILKAAADADGLAWDSTESAWKNDNKRREKEKEDPLPTPKALKEPRPEPAYPAYLGLDEAHIRENLPQHLRSFGVWTARPAAKGAKERVWRIGDDFGYGPNVGPGPEFTYTGSSSELLDAPTLTVIDEGGMLFRRVASEKAWPKLDPTGWYLLKMSWPLGVGDLWAELAPVMDRLIVVVSAEDLRREDAQINSRLSWEMCAEQTLAALQRNPTANRLLSAKHVIVSFGSAGALWVARGTRKGNPSACLLADPQELEDDHARGFDGTTYGFQTSFTAGIAHHLMQGFLKAAEPRVDAAAMKEGILAGLAARRLLLKLGHGPVGSQAPGIPVSELGHEIAARHINFISVDLPCPLPDCPWTILQANETCEGDSPDAPLSGPGELVARYGAEALPDIPALNLGRLFTVDRSEIESLRAIDALIRDYEDTKVQKKPLSIGVFGPPGAGKSFGVRALAESILGEKVPFLEFNLSQFTDPEELIGAFHRVRDAVLKGVTPVAFWDEFDSQKYKWLQYLLAPMQDGAFQEGQITHPIGKCIFIFAGGTSDTIGEFGVRKPETITEEQLALLEPQKRQERDEQVKSYSEFKLLKGPDFISRLHGFLNVLGPNRRVGKQCSDTTWPIRRAIMLRGFLGLRDGDDLNIDAGLLNALLNVSIYENGARSFEKIVKALDINRVQGHLHRSALLPRPLLDRETNSEEFYRLLTERDSFKNHQDIDTLAAAVNFSFVEAAEQSKLTAEPNDAWTIHPAITKEFKELTADYKESNRAAARRIPDHLALIGFVVEPWAEDEGDSWKKPLEIAIEKHIDRLAQAEHLGWKSERIQNGWTPGERDNDLKRHNLLVPWKELSPMDQDKDRSSARSIPYVLDEAKYKAVRKPNK